MARATLTLVVAALCVLAGCSGFDGRGGATTEETVTPAPVPPVPTDPARGISESEIDAPVVASNHRAALADRSYTTRTRIRWRGVNGSTYTETTVHRVAADGRRFHVVAAYARQRSENRTGHELWYDGNRTVLRLENATGGAEYRRLDDGRVVDYPRARTINVLFARLVPRNVTQPADGATVVSGSIEDVDELWGLPQFRDERNATMSARIAPAGYVERIAIGFDATVHDRPVDVRLTIDVTDVGSTTVSEPAWVENVSSRPATSTSTPIE